MLTYFSRDTHFALLAQNSVQVNAVVEQTGSIVAKVGVGLAYAEIGAKVTAQLLGHIYSLVQVAGAEFCILQCITFLYLVE
jgi:hypothetical protein